MDIITYVDKREESFPVDKSKELLLPELSLDNLRCLSWMRPHLLWMKTLKRKFRQLLRLL
jgi:hypothetical protein